MRREGRRKRRSVSEDVWATEKDGRGIFVIRAVEYGAVRDLAGWVEISLPVAEGWGILKQVIPTAILLPMCPAS